jgi:hypothetical protein
MPTAFLVGTDPPRSNEAVAGAQRFRTANCCRSARTSRYRAARDRPADRNAKTSEASTESTSRAYATPSGTSIDATATTFLVGSAHATALARRSGLRPAHIVAEQNASTACSRVSRCGRIPSLTAVPVPGHNRAVDLMVHATAAAILSTENARRSLMVAASTSPLCSPRCRAFRFRTRLPVISYLPKLVPVCVFTDLDFYPGPRSSATFAVERG